MCQRLSLAVAEVIVPLALSAFVSPEIESVTVTWIATRYCGPAGFPHGSDTELEQAAARASTAAAPHRRGESARPGGLALTAMAGDAR